ncbi:MAG: hypothetical protein JSW11_13320 [Candidatus Heimdallarchaeota archaeon]|nr:MAG: hypothetical protein JSW11_13320 [Candidatus Heimdallarchaeota archaeon]
MILKIETESNERAELIHKSIDPDNLTEPPMTFYSIYTSNSLEYRINNVLRVETVLATLIDLLSAFQTIENALNAFTSEIG